MRPFEKDLEQQELLAVKVVIQIQIPNVPLGPSSPTSTCEACHSIRPITPSGPYCGPPKKNTTSHLRRWLKRGVGDAEDRPRGRIQGTQLPAVAPHWGVRIIGGLSAHAAATCGRARKACGAVGGRRVDQWKSGAKDSVFVSVSCTPGGPQIS